MNVTGSLSGVSTSALFLPIPNAPFGVMISGSFSGAVLYLTRATAISIAYPGNAAELTFDNLMAWQSGLITAPADGDFALMYDPSGGPIAMHGAGGIVIDPPYAAAGTIAKIAAGGASMLVYKLACSAIGSGTVDYTFY